MGNEFSMSGLTATLKASFRNNKQRIERGGLNCIPSPLTFFRQNWPGIQQKRIYLISGGTKAAKSQITNYLFILGTLFYCYKNPGKLKVKIFYFPLEMTKEEVTEMVICYVINYLTNGRIIVSPNDLESVDERSPLSEEVFTLMETVEFLDIMNIYENMVSFYEEDNRVGIYKVLNNYAQTHGQITYKTLEINETDELGVTQRVSKKVFDSYIANDPDEYIISIIDHVSLLSPVRGESDLRITISEFAKDIIKLRNRYNYTFAIVQQQNIESTGLEAFKAKKIRPTVAGLADCKDIGKACNMMIGITNPHYFELEDYYGYDITKLKGYIRFIEITINRNGKANDLCPLYFNGSCNDFKELPSPNSPKMQDWYNYISRKSKLFFYKTENISIKFLHKSNLFSTFAFYLSYLINKLKTKRTWQ